MTEAIHGDIMIWKKGEYFREINLKYSIQCSIIYSKKYNIRLGFDRLQPEMAN